jgi:hypothetical protein
MAKRRNKNSQEQRPARHADAAAAPQEHPTRSRLVLMVPAVAALGALTIYIATLAPTVPAGDSGELITASYVAGVAHPPGYPLYTMMGWIATHLWPGSPAVIMNFLSALFHAATVGLIALLTARLVVPGWPNAENRDEAAVAGFAAGAALAVSTGFWAYSLVAEVFALNDLFAVALLLLAIEWYRDRSRVWALWLVGLLSGLAAAHHQTIVLLGPGLAVLLIAGAIDDAERARGRGKRDRRPRQIKPSHFPVAVAFIAVGLLAYLYLPIAASTDPVMNFDDPQTLSRFQNVITRGPYGSFSLLPGSERGGQGENLLQYGAYLGRAFTPVGIALAALGAGWLGRRRPTEALAILVAFLASGASFVLISSAPFQTELQKGIVERFYILSSVILAIAIGAGFFFVLESLRDRLSARTTALIGIGVIVALVGSLAAYRWDDVDQTSNRVAENYGRDLLFGLDAGALLITRGDHNYTSLVYAQHVDGVRPDVIIVEAELLQLRSYIDEMAVRFPAVDFPFKVYSPDQNSLSDFVAANIDGFPIYVAGPMPVDVTDEYAEVRAGLVRRLAPLGTSDEYELILSDPEIVTHLTHPDREYADKTWERLMALHYGGAVHSLAFAFHEPGANDNDPLVEEMYRLSIEVEPPPEAYKNLGLFLFQRNRDAEEIIDLWETYLDFDTDDDQAGAIRIAIDELKTALTPAP